MKKKEIVLVKAVGIIALIGLTIYVVKLPISASQVDNSQVENLSGDNLSGDKFSLGEPPLSDQPEDIMNESPEDVNTEEEQAPAEIVLNLGKTFQSDSFQYIVSTKNANKKTGTVMLSGMSFPKTEVRIPETVLGPDGYTYSVTQIGDKCFYGNTKVTSIFIPSTIRNIRECAFSGCKNLKKIEVDKYNQHYKSQSNVLYSKDGKTLVALICAGISYTPPKAVTTIASGAFVYCADLRTISIPKTVKKMGMIFDNSCPNLKTVTFKSSAPPIIEKCIKIKDGRMTQLLCNLDVYHVGLQILVPKGSETTYSVALKEIFKSNRKLQIVPYKR